MSQVVIRTDGLGKQYRIGGRQNEFRTLRDTLTDVFNAPFQRVKRLWRGQPSGAADMNETIWALKNVSLEIKRGEVVGIIGRNGAGKTTLLKILSRITEPTEGFAKIHGRVGSLLEVGTGFHPELTGRENIYLNGAILGMRKAEIVSKFDEIVDFAEIEKFIDTPVKYYSSGMYVRLAFAVAAHLEPEILLVDEVLAVGDAAFQRKCLGKMGDVAQEGRTVLFVSHNITAVWTLCSESILLDAGQVVLKDDTRRVIERYHAALDETMEIPLRWRKDRTGNGALRFTRLWVRPPDAGTTDAHTLVSSRPAVISMEYESINSKPLETVVFSVIVADINGNVLFTCGSRHQGTVFEQLPITGRIVCDIPSLPLAPGIYNVSLYSKVKENKADYIVNAGKFTVMEGDFFGTGVVPTARKHGPILVHHSWEFEEVYENP